MTLSKFSNFGRRVLSMVLTATTILWSVGVSLFMPNMARAAITATSPVELIPPSGMHVPASSFDLPLVKFGLTQSASETLSSVTVTITNNTAGAVTNNTLADHISQLAVFKDSNNNGVFDAGTDLLAGTASPVFVATNTTQIATGSNNALAASGGLATNFFVMAKTAAGWGGADSFKVNMATNGIVTSANSPSITALTGSNAVDAAVGGGGGGFGVQKITYINASTVDVVFTDTFDLNSGNATSTANYTLSGSGAAAVTSVLLLPDNRSVRVTASGATLVDTGASLIAVSANVKSNLGFANAATAATPIMGGFQPLVISEVKAGAVGDEFGEFIELYNRGGSAVATSSLRLHLINAAGTVDISVPLVFSTATIPLGGILSNKFFLIAPTGTTPGGLVPDATYATSAVAIALGGAAYISNSAASSTAVIDRVCWGTHPMTSGDCEGNQAPTLANDGGSIERKANNSSTAASMRLVAGDLTNGNGQDSQSNSFDFLSEAAAQPQNTGSTGEAPGGGSQGGAGNMAPMIQHTSIFQATTGTAFTLIARMTDDGGVVPSNNTQFIYCVTNTSCTPASSTPIFGTSVGSGWFKFTTTSADWAENKKSKLFYYLQAKDSASPAKVRVFTNDPSFDSDTSNVNPVSGQTGIQTAALQASKALSVGLTIGNLGSAAISGRVVDSTNIAVSGVTVWIDGTQFAATTGNDGSFSFANVGPSGGKQIRMAKEGYVDQQSSIFIPPSGLVSLPDTTLYSGNMGQGGDFNGPKVVSSNPGPNSTGFPSQGPGGGAPSIFLNFSKTMDTTTYVTSSVGNASNIYLTEAGSSTRLAGAVIAPNSTQAMFTPSAALTVGKGYTLYVTPGVKDTAGNPISGNGPGGQYVLMFSTAGQFFSGSGDFGGGGATFGMGSAFPPFVKGSMPAPGAKNVGRNARVFVTFSEAMQDTAGNRAKVTLYKVASPFTSSESKAAVSATNSFDSSGKILIITPSANLDASSHYRVEVLGGIASAKGVPLGNPGQTGSATMAFYMSDLDTGAGTDATAPTIAATIPASSATGVSTINPIVVNFSEAMDPSTVTDSSISVKLGSTAVDGTMVYDSNSWTAKFIPTYGLSPTSTYTITVTVDVKDIAQNALATALLRTFTTGSADTSVPTVVSAQGNDFAMKVTFSKAMLAVPNGDINFANSVLKAANYAIKVVNSSGVVQSTVTLPATATLTYDPPSRSVAINGLPSVSGFSAGSTLFNVSVSSVKDIGFNDIATGGNVATTTAQSSSMGGGFMSGGGGFQDASGNIIQGGQFGPPPTEFASFKSSGIGFVPSVKARPANPTAGAVTKYEIEAPISQQVPAGGFIDITFPEGTDLSLAKKHTASPFNSDMNGQGTGIVAFATSEGTLPSGWATGGVASDGVIVNTSAGTLRVILGSVATRSESSDTHDFLHFDIDAITNPTTVAGVGTSGNSATVETKKADGTVLETLTSGSFFTTAAGNFTVRGRVLSGATGLNGVTVFLMSPQTGPQSTTTANGRFNAQDGEFMFQGLVGGMYMLGADQYFKVGATSYTTNFPAPVNVNVTNCASNICAQNISVVDASTGASVTIGITGTFYGDAVDMFASGPGSFRVVTTTLSGTLSNNTSNSVRLNSNGTWSVGFGPSLQGGMFNGNQTGTTTRWIAPKPKTVLVSGCPANCVASPTTVAFSVSAANKTIKFTVKDQSANKLGQTHVFAYSPALDQGNDTTANADGTGSIGLSYGTYKIGASIPGMPGGSERTIAIKDDGGTDKVFIDGSSSGVALSAMSVTDLVLTISKPSYTISGKVTDGTNPIANAPVFAFRTNGPGHADSFTNSSGEYTLYVSNGTWKVKTVLPDYGELPPKTVVVSGASQSSQNFEPDTSSVNYATITKSFVFDSDGNGVYSAASDEEISNAIATIYGTTGDLNNDGDVTDNGESVSYLNTVTTDTNGSSTLKLPPGSYTLKTWSPNYGDFASTTQSIVVNGSGTVTTAPYDVLAPTPSTVTVNILDTYGNVTTTDKIVVEFQQIGGKTNLIQEFGGTASTTVSLPRFDAGADSVALNNATSTSPANFYLMTVVAPGLSQSGITAAGGSGTIMATSTATTGLWKVEVDSATETVNVRLPDINYLTGTVKDENGAAVPDAKVILRDSNGETLEVQANSSGNYVAKVSDGTYQVYASKDGYLDTATTLAVTVSSSVADAVTTMDAFDYSISGTITAGGSVAADATVRAEKLGGGIAMATTDSDGNYSLKVTTGSWKVSAAADGYTEKEYSAVVGASGNVGSINIALSATNSSLAGNSSQSVTPQNGGQLTDTAANFDIEAPAAALSNSSDSGTISTKEISNVVGLGTGAPIAGEAKEISSLDGDGDNIATLNDDISVGATYTTSELVTSVGSLTIAKIEKIQMASLDETVDNWENLATTIAYKDSSDNYVEPISNLSNVSSVTYTGQTVHLSVFNPIQSSDGLAPAAPTNVAATGGNGSVVVSWTAPSTNSDGSSLSDLLGYEVYRSTINGGNYTQVNSSDISGTSFTDTSVTNGIVYYYRITAADTGGLESSMASMTGGVTPTAGSSSSSGGGGGGGQPTTGVRDPVLYSPSVTITNAVSSTVSTKVLSLKFNVTNVTEVLISESQNFAGAQWQTYNATKQFVLSAGNGLKNLYVKFRSAYGAESAAVLTPLTMNAPDNEQLPTLATTPVTTPSVAPAKPTTPGVIAPMVAAAASAVQLTPPEKASYQPGEKLKFAYSYVNVGKKMVSIKIVRQFVNDKGQVVATASARRALKAKTVFNGKVDEPVGAKFPPGDYIVKIKILDAKNKVLDENAFTITVEKPKKKVFKLGAVSAEDSAITFEAKNLAKVPRSGGLPVILKLTYTYTNTDSAPHKVKMARELLNGTGKVIAVKTGQWSMKVAEHDSQTFTQPVTSAWDAGDYSIRIRAYDAASGAVLAENNLGFSIELE